MATVRFSSDLRHRVRSKASQIFEDRIDKAKENPPNLAESIYDLVFRDTKELMYSLPDKYFCMDIGIRLRGFKGKGWDDDINEDMQMEFPNKQKRRFPESIQDKEFHGLAKHDWPYTLNANDARWKDIKEEYKEYCLVIYKLEREKKVFVDGVKEVINAYATLAPALKAWPALWDLIPEDKKEKHREIVERRKASDTAQGLAKEINLSKLTGHVTADKLTR